MYVCVYAIYVCMYVCKYASILNNPWPSIEVTGYAEKANKSLKTSGVYDITIY